MSRMLELGPVALLGHKASWELISLLLNLRAEEGRQGRWKLGQLTGQAAGWVQDRVESCMVVWQGWPDPELSPGSQYELSC